MNEPTELKNVPQWLQTLYDFTDGSVPYYIVTLKCDHCGWMGLISLCEKNKDWSPDCFLCEHKSPQKRIVKKLESFVNLGQTEPERVDEN